MFREFVKGGLAVLRDLARDRAKLVAENALLRQQVIVLKRSAPRPHLKSRDRFTIATITKIFPVLLDAVAIVRPETVVRWHRAFWRLLWHRRSQRPVGRPPIDADTRALIIRMWKIRSGVRMSSQPSSPSSDTMCQPEPWPSTGRRMPRG